MKGEAMSSLYLPPPEYIEYLVDRRPARKPRVPRIRRWIVIG
jgi:hypothetical protein